MSKAKKSKGNQESLARVGKFVTMIQNKSVQQVLGVLSRRKKPVSNQDLIDTIGEKATAAAVNKALIRLREFNMLNINDEDKRKYLYSLADDARAKIESVESLGSSL